MVSPPARSITKTARNSSIFAVKETRSGSQRCSLNVIGDVVRDVVLVGTKFCCLVIRIRWIAMFPFFCRVNWSRPLAFPRRFLSSFGVWPTVCWFWRWPKNIFVEQTQNPSARRHFTSVQDTVSFYISYACARDFFASSLTLWTRRDSKLSRNCFQVKHLHKCNAHFVHDCLPQWGLQPGGKGWCECGIVKDVHSLCNWK